MTDQELFQNWWDGTSFCLCEGLFATTTSKEPSSQPSPSAGGRGWREQRRLQTTMIAEAFTKRAICVCVNVKSPPPSVRKGINHENNLRVWSIY
jgi:hypothetical protein